MQYVKVSQLNKLDVITNDDLFPIVDSGSTIIATTYKSDLDILAGWLTGSTTASRALSSISVSFASFADSVISSSLGLTASHLLYTASIPYNGSASYSLSSSFCETASYIPLSNLSVVYTTNAVSASWASSSISASYVSSSGVDGVVTSASYSLTSSYAITSSNAYSSSYALTASNAVSSSHVARFASSVATKPIGVFGPFFANSNQINGGTSAYIEWSQWDNQKRSVAFYLEAASDIVVKCTVNVMSLLGPNSNPEDAPFRNLELTTYLGAKLSAEGYNEFGTSRNSELDAICAVRHYSINAESRTMTATMVFPKTNLSAGQYRVYVAPLKTTKTGILAYEHGSDSLGDRQSIYSDFLDDAIVYGNSLLKIPLLEDSVKVLVYSKEVVRAGDYSNDYVEGQATYVWWQLTYKVNYKTINAKRFYWYHTYTSALGDGIAYWVSPNMGNVGAQFIVYICLPSDMQIGETIESVNGWEEPTGEIISGPSPSTTPCSTTDPPDPDSPCGQWYYWGGRFFWWHCP